MLFTTLCSDGYSIPGKKLIETDKIVKEGNSTISHYSCPKFKATGTGLLKKHNNNRYFFTFDEKYRENGWG